MSEKQEFNKSVEGEWITHAVTKEPMLRIGTPGTKGGSTLTLEEAVLLSEWIAATAYNTLEAA